MPINSSPCHTSLVSHQIYVLVSIAAFHSRIDLCSPSSFATLNYVLTFTSHNILPKENLTMSGSLIKLRFPCFFLMIASFVFPFTHGDYCIIFIKHIFAGKRAENIICRKNGNAECSFTIPPPPWTISRRPNDTVRPGNQTAIFLAAGFPLSLTLCSRCMHCALAWFLTS